ncbi:MAG: hypothetical protein JAZ02_11955, partial [Candidatus Thiodiazotropha endolucinida]|nr:hypothetical protein [Candidatus Thiodiazotropha endolucinida]
MGAGWWEGLLCMGAGWWEGLLCMGAGWWEGLIRLRLTPSGHLRYARCPAALRALSNEGFESKPPYPPNKRGLRALLSHSWIVIKRTSSGVRFFLWVAVQGRS